MISYEPLPSAIVPSHHMQQQQSHNTNSQPQQQMTQQFLHQQQQQQQQMHQQMQQHFQQQQQQQQANNGDSNNPLDYELDASSSAEEIWDLDSHTVKRYNNASGDTSASSTGHGSMESYPDLSHPTQQHHY